MCNSNGNNLNGNNLNMCVLCTDKKHRALFWVLFKLETACRFLCVLSNLGTSCSFPWVSFNLGTRVSLTLFSDTVYFSSFFLPDSAPSIINTRCYHTRLLGHTNGTACVIQCVVPCLTWHDSSSTISIIITLSYSVNTFIMVYSIPGHDSLVFSFTVLCLDFDYEHNLLLISTLSVYIIDKYHPYLHDDAKYTSST